ncbi:hypothetical protein PybrP1_004323 [[Pythium] brassicae (nom. inval.)]|nr:hypothetical protein PybrP1_004323 [[Pythium] brassicae (nom. inval.)]
MGAEPRAGVRVCARFRPQNKLELKQQAVECVHVDEGSGAVRVDGAAGGRGAADSHAFAFDQVFGPSASQRAVYEATAQPLFAGIIPRAMADVFDGIRHMQAELEFIVRVSYVEIYLEKIRDLLEPASSNLSVRESRERGVWVAGATEVCCASADEMLGVMRLGGANRVISSTRMNNDSSRSHSVFIITIEQRNTVAEYKVLVAERNQQIAALEERIRQLDGGASAGVAPEPVAPDRVQQLLAKIEQLEDEHASKAGEMASLEERCAELELQTKECAHKALETAAVARRNDEFVHKVAFLESELEAKTKECDSLSELLEIRRNKETMRAATAHQPPPVIAEDAALPLQSAGTPRTPPVESFSLVQTNKANADRGRADSAVSLDNDLLRHQLGARAHELHLSSRRVHELTEELANCRSFYESQVFALEEKLRAYGTHLRALTDAAESDDKAAQLDTFVQRTKTLRSVRGGGGTTVLPPPRAPRQRSEGADIPANVAATAAPLQRARVVSSASSPDGWQVDDEVFPVAPIDMESPVVKRLISSMPERGREKLAKWLVFVLEGRDIRANFHPEISIEGINEDLNRDMRKLIVPLLKNRRDLMVQAAVRTRFVRVTDLKITLAHKHQDTLDVETAASEAGDVAASFTADASGSESRPRGHAPSKVWAQDHVFYGPKTDPSSASVLHKARVLLPGKDRFTSEPVDLSASVNDSKTILDMKSAGSSSGSAASGQTPAPSSASGAASASGGGGMFGRLRSKTSVGNMLGDVKNRLSARYHKHHVHDDTLCDGCGMSPIVGGRWKCNTCESFELCDACYGAGCHGFEISNEMCRRIEQAAAHKHRSLAEYPELFELLRRHICGDDVIQFRRVVDWLTDMVSGHHVASIHRKIIVKRGLHPEIRARLVAQLGALASERPDIVLKTEWFVEKSADDEDEDDGVEDETEQVDDGGTGGDAASEREAAKRSSSASGAAAQRHSEVRLETLRMYVTDATIEDTVESVRTQSYAELLLPPPPPVTSHRSVSTGSASSLTATASDAAEASDAGALDGKAVAPATHFAF